MRLPLSRLVSLASASRSAPRMLATAAPAISAPMVTLNDGYAHPQIGFGTYKVGFIPASASAAAAGTEASGAQEATAAKIVENALRVGYRFLDCAEFYGNEHEVGAAIAVAGVPREELYLASKVWTTKIYEGPAAVRRQIETTLADLGTTYLDLYLVHWPVPGSHVAAYEALQQAQKDGLVRSIGVSNYAVEDLEELAMAPGIKVTPAVNQIETNPFLHRPKTLAYHKEKGIAVQAYRALRDGKAFDDETVRRIAADRGKTPAQILGAWCLARDCIYMPKSTKVDRMIENAAVLDFSLDAADLAALDALTKPAALDAYRALYEKCVVRDTPLTEDDPRIKRDITIG